MSNDPRFHHIQQSLAPLRTSLLEHPLYDEIDSLENLQIFMQYHVFAVWDFMSLLKALQHRICGTDVPWLAPQAAGTARFINEIVLAEESDEDGQGGYASHFEMYHHAMRQAGASTRSMDDFLSELKEGRSVTEAMAAGKLDEPIQSFVGTTFDLIASGDLPAMASAFTFGREDLLPDIFQRLVDELNVEAGGKLEALRFYLHRHIEVDGDSHGPLATQMVIRLCGDSDTQWTRAAEAADRALRARKHLWDGIGTAIQRQKPTPA